MIDPLLLHDLCCPESYQPLRLADVALIQKINAEIESGKLRARGGRVVEEKLEGGLLREDGTILYPIRGQIPVLLIEEAIALPVGTPGPVNARAALP